MPKTKTRPPVRRKAPARKPSSRSRAALVKLFRPIVRELVAEELERIEDRLDAQDGREANREAGEVPHDEFWRKRGL